MLKWVILLVAVCFGVTFLQYQRAKSANQKLVQLQLSTSKEIMLKDSSIAILSNRVLDRDSLSSSLSAAKELNGKLLAALKIKLIPKVDTVYNTDTTTIASGEIRTLDFSDTLETGTMIGKVTAPPFPSNLSLYYVFSPFPLNATVSLISINDTTAVFVVKYTGGQSTVSSTYSKIPSKEKRLSYHIDGLYSITGSKEMLLRAGLTIKLPLFYGLAEAQHLIDANHSFVGVGLRYSF